MKFIKKHLTAIIVVLVCLILLILAGFAVYRMFYPSNDKSVYGDRLNNAPDVTDEAINKIKEELNATELVNSITYKQSVTTLKFFIDVKEDVKIAKAKELGDIVIKGLEAKVVEFYDIAVYLTQNNGEMKEYPAIGQHAKASKEFNWVVNKEVSSSEE